jgi:hypothetical protein
VPLQNKKLLVWSAISANRVFGPFVFDGIVNSINYLKMLKSFFWPKVLRTRDYQKCYFQQDGASPHKASLVQTRLTERFGEHCQERVAVSVTGLNPCDYLLWGYLKQKVYNQQLKTLKDLRSNLTRKKENIPARMLKDTFWIFEKGANYWFPLVAVIFNKNKGH